MTGGDGMWRVCIRAAPGAGIASRTTLIYTQQEAERVANSFNLDPYWAPFRATHHAHAWVERV